MKLLKEIKFEIVCLQKEKFFSLFRIVMNFVTFLRDEKSDDESIIDFIDKLERTLKRNNYNEKVID